MGVQELRRGLWRWTARHPDWTEGEDWEPDVGCVYYEAPDAVVLIDPLVPEDEQERFWHALDRDVERAGRPVAVLLTVPWHDRSSGEIAERYSARVYAHVKALEESDARPPVTDPFRLGDPLPGGVVAIDAHWAWEALYWLPEPRALVTGDVILGSEDGVRLCPESWLPEGQTLADLRRELRHLLDLPAELVLVSHGRPVLERAHEALAEALRD